MEIETTNVRSAETDTVVEKCTLELQESNTHFSNTHSKKADVEKIYKVTECAKLSETNENRLVETMNTERNDTIMSTRNDNQEQSDESDDDSDDDSDGDDEDDDEDEDEDEDDCEKLVTVDEIISKAVIKKSRLLPDKFIAKIKDRPRNL
ncbi:trigger factor-like [Mytilus californianus]|uniref:trigger factor-like n=1 Tax=Mytilus californianus TaxID=6549 RepID=UPI0022467848|nr:trigger factor-like [Mytilus californianus]